MSNALNVGDIVIINQLGLIDRYEAPRTYSEEPSILFTRSGVRLKDPLRVAAVSEQGGAVVETLDGKRVQGTWDTARFTKVPQHFPSDAIFSTGDRVRLFGPAYHGEALAGGGPGTVIGHSGRVYLVHAGAMEGSESDAVAGYDGWSFYETEMTFADLDRALIATKGRYFSATTGYLGREPETHSFRVDAATSTTFIALTDINGTLLKAGRHTRAVLVEEEILKIEQNGQVLYRAPSLRGGTTSQAGLAERAPEAETCPTCGATLLRRQRS